MKVLSRHTITIADNDNRPVDVVPMPKKTYEGRLTYEASATMRSLINGEIDDTDDA